MNRFKKVLLSRTESTWLIMIILSGLSIRLAAIALFTHVPEADELAYIAMAENLVAGQGLMDNHGNRAMYNMGYAFLILAPVFAIFHDSILAVKIINALLGGLAIYLCHAVAREAGAGKNGRLMAALMWALYLPAALYTVYVLKESLLIPLMLGVIWCGLHFVKTASVRAALLCGVLFGLIAITGNAALSLLVPVLAALLYFSGKGIRNASAAVLILLATVLVAAPWVVRNVQVLGAPVLNTNGGFNLYLGNNPLATGMFMSIADTPRGKSWRELQRAGEVQASNTLKTEALAWIAKHPVDFMTLALKKLQLFWTPPFHAGQGPGSLIEQLVRIVWALQFVVLMLAALGGIFLRSPECRSSATLWLAVAAYTGVHMIFYVIFRYREPIMPLICVLSAMGIENLLRRFAQKPVQVGERLVSG